MRTLKINLTIIFFISLLNLVHSQYHPKGEFSTVEIQNYQTFKPLGSTFSNSISFKDNLNNSKALISYGHFPAQNSGKLILSQETGSILIDNFNIEMRSNNKIGFFLNSTQQIGIASNTIPSTIGSIDLSTYKLFVNGGVLAKEVRVRTDWADYVFDPSYSLLSLPEVEDFIHTNGHLPNVPNATTVAEEGIEIGNMTRIQQEKIEELTLYTIQLYKENQAQQAIIKDMQDRLTKLEATSKN